MRALYAFIALGALFLVGCGSGGASTNEDAAAAAAQIDASKRGVVAQPDTDLNQAGGGGAGVAGKPHR